MAEDFPSFSTSKKSFTFPVRISDSSKSWTSPNSQSKFHFPQKTKTLFPQNLTISLEGALGRFPYIIFWDLTLRYLMSFLRSALMANFKKLQLSLILRVAGQIWQILQITAVICRILQIPPGSVNSKPNIQKKKTCKSLLEKNLTIYTSTKDIAIPILARFILG